MHQRNNSFGSIVKNVIVIVFERVYAIVTAVVVVTVATVPNFSLCHLEEASKSNEYE